MGSDVQHPALFVVGTRAQLIKVAPVLVACERADFPTRLLMTGQHRETMDDLLTEFGVKTPLEQVVPASERASVGSLLRWLPKAYFRLRRRLRVLARESGGAMVVVHGDTLSTLIGALAASASRLQVLHLESGLTSGRWHDPFPEELVRRWVFRHTQVAFCPDVAAAQHMRDRYRCEVVNTEGNTVLDAVVLSGAGAHLATDDSGGVVVSLHRVHNLFSANRLSSLVELVVAVAETCPVHFVLHPATRKRLISRGHMIELERAAGVRLLPRMGYREFLTLAAGASCVLTDGGSNQEELAALGVPTIVMRERTERADGIGENAMMERDVPGGVLEFLRSGGHRMLRRPSRVSFDLGPSRRVAAWLSERGSSR